MGHVDGICAIFVDESADLNKAIRVVLDSKITYPSACNTTETLLLHEFTLRAIWPPLPSRNTLKCDSITFSAIPSSPFVLPSTEEDYNTEFLELTLAVKLVTLLDSAMEHINSHSSHHTDSIITES